MASQGQKRRDGDSSSTWSSSSTSDSTSTTMFDVTKAVFMTTTTTSEEEESSRQAAQGSNSEIEVNVQQQGPATSGVTSQSLPGPAGFNVFLPMGRSVPVVFTDQGICIAGYNAPAAAMETEDEVTTSTTTTEQQQQQQAQDAPVAGIFQLLPAGSYLPTFVNMEQLDKEDGECDEDETPAEEYNEEEPGREGESEPAIGIVEATVHERETFVRMGPQQGDTMGTMGWPQPASPSAFQQTLLMPPPLSPPMPPPVSQPMYAGMQTGQGYMPQQYAMPPPFGWQAQMMQSQGQAPAYGQPFGMPPQWPTYQPFWPGLQWQLGQSQWLQGPHMPEGSQMMQQQHQHQQRIQQEIMTDQLQQDILVSHKRRQAPTHSSRQIRSVSLPCRISMEGFSSQTTSLTEVEVQAHVGPYPCTVRRVLSTQTSLQNIAPTSRCVSVESTHADIADKSPEREGRIDITQVVHMSSDQLPTEATPITQVTLGTETCPTVHELWNEKALLVPGAANVHVDTPCVTYGTQTVQEVMGPVEVAFGQQTYEPPCRLPSPLPDRVCSETHIMAHQYHVGRKALDVPQATVDLQTVEQAIEVKSKACGVQATQEHDQLPCAMDETQVIQGHAGAQQPVVGVQIVQQPTLPPHIEVEVQASGGPFEAGHIVSKVHTVLKQEDPPCVAFGIQATEHPATRLMTLKKLVSDPRVTLAVQTTNTSSSQEKLTGHNLEAHSVFRGAQVSSITGASGTVCVDGTTQVSASPLQLHVTQAPYKHTESQAVQTLSLESLGLASRHTTQTISVGQQSEGIQTGMLIHSTAASSLSGLNLQKQHDFNAQHGNVFQASQLPLAQPEIPRHDIEVQCNYEPFVHTTRSITTVNVGQTRGQADGHREAIVQCNYETFDEEAKRIVMAPPRPSHDAEVQFGRDPVEDFTRDFRLPEQPTYDFGAQCMYEPDREITRATFITQSRVMHDFEQQYNYGRVDWHARDADAVQEKPLQDNEQQRIYEQKRRGAKITYSAQSMQMQDFGMQHDTPIAISPPPTSTHVMYGMVDMGVGDSRPHDVVEGHRRFPWRPTSHVRSRPSLSSCASSVFMFGNLEIPHLANAGTQAGEIGRHRLSPTFAVSAPRTETASYPCVAVCSRNTVNHPCSLNLSSYPGRLSQAAQTRDAVFQTEEPVAVRASTVDVGARSVSRGPAMRTPLHEAAVQAFAGPPASRPVSPPSSPSYYQGPFGMSPSGSSRCTSPARDASFQTDRLADVRRSPPGGPFQPDFTGKAAEATGNLGHEIMIQASTVVPAAGSAWGVPSNAQQHTSIAAMTEVYPCGHLPQVLQMRETPPSPPPLSPPPHSPLPHSPPPCPCLAAYGWPPVVVEHKIGLGGKLADFLKPRKQQGITPEQPSVEDKGTLEGPYVAPVWGSTDGEQDYLYQDGSQAEGSLEEGEYSDTGAVVAAASLVPDGMGAPGTVRRSSVETTSK
ncbi:hypothetical protein HPB50_015879 [Hyalomma asiaticum]|uniref:Uncharacterized protein n=1 Tax=Hyalomma asiaticum TaxID=266040 RepID=A0ACB7S0C9_HYAAI|nr:hypothetical protein HPB50_015879 [Hyalomma asiaticum]